ncbi:MAG: hypothetical protein HRU20_31730, partial [Pseudomonadales bacterium]|nr:hypothetical protein [Pseudomonadales bacterium]
MNTFKVLIPAGGYGQIYEDGATIQLVASSDTVICEADDQRFELDAGE